MTLFDGSTAIGSSPVGNDGSWGVFPSLLAPGLHNLTAIESDAAARVSPIGLWAVGPGDYAERPPDLDHPEFLLVGGV